jgi:hypothetical protein
MIQARRAKFHQVGLDGQAHSNGFSFFKSNIGDAAKSGCRAVYVPLVVTIAIIKRVLPSRRLSLSTAALSFVRESEVLAPSYLALRLRT